MRTKGPEVYDIIIPIYNAYDDLVECIDSIFKQTDYPFRLLLIDDKSPDVRIKPYLDHLQTMHSNIIVLYNDINQGFVKTVNRGMEYSNTDVILLNSDTILTKNWLSKMNDCAYSSKNIATVTPFTNNGTICSVPNFGQDNAIPEGFTIASFADFVEHVSFRKYPMIPTAVGFCMLIKRNILNEVGLFDDINYLKGYGEENDFCCRVTEHGYINVLDDATFVYHKGSMSFKDEKKGLIKRNSEVLNRKFPYYFNRVEQFIQTNPLTPYIENINYRMKTFEKKSKVLFVVHNTIDEDWNHKRGGTEFHISDLIGELKEDFVFYTLVSNGKRILLKEYNRGNVTQYNFYLSYQIETHTLFHDEYKEIFNNILNTFNIDIVHIHHFQKHTFDIPYVCKELGIPVLFTVHDFHLICPSVLLLDKNGEYCLDSKTDLKCHDCLSCKMGYETKFRLKWSNTVREMLPLFDQLIFPSESAKINFNKEYDLSKMYGKFKVIEHGLNIPKPIKSKIKHAVNKDNFKVAFIGTFAVHKGSSIINDIVSIDSNKSDISWYLIGEIHDPLLSALQKENVFKLGSYTRESIVEVIKQYQIDLVCLLSICPETFSYTLSEAWASETPVLVNDRGALGTRVEDGKTGWVIDDLSPKSILAAINNAKSSDIEYSLVQKNVINLVKRTVTDMAVEYKSVYEPLIVSKVPLSNTEGEAQNKKSFTNYQVYLSTKVINNSNSHLEQELREKEAQLHVIYNTLGWRFLNYIRKQQKINKYAKRVLLYALKIKNR